MIDYVREFLCGLVQGPAQYVAVSGMMILLIIVCSVAAYYLTRLLLQVIERLVLRSPTDWDDDLLTPRLLRAVSQLSPAIVVSWMLPRCFDEIPGSVAWIDGLTSLYILWAVVMIILIFIDNLYGAFVRRPRLHAYAVNGIFQMFKLIVIGVAVIIALSILIGKTPVAILTALGASAAVLMLVFKDTILGLVASVQLTANNMLRKGDWIIVPKHSANGEVIDVSLSTVKVRNWDNTVTTVPPYSLISDSFQNYRPMQESGGRRVCRAVYVDVNTVRFCTPAELDDLAARGWLEGIEPEDVRHTVNLQLLRCYLDRFLSAHPEVNSDLTYMVRQLDPTPSGLPLQLYFFTRTTAWKEYERVQSDIFDHVYAVVGHFGLSIFQSPAGRDLLKLQ
ncbi:MAG: mechanosensitive ion channel family protein [Muribaculaceae bacterium]|nr:mechanosensitive ion channel family protein [Muribaculaceae bacterium]